MATKAEKTGLTLSRVTRALAVDMLIARATRRMAPEHTLSDVNPETGLTRAEHFRLAAEQNADNEAKRVQKLHRAGGHVGETLPDGRRW